MSTNVSTSILRHPCFHGCVTSRYGRVHLPIAPACNIQCNYCNRSYDCVNESRPGVASTLLQPEDAVGYLALVLQKEPRISVVGIAGPGDPFCDPKRTLSTLRLVRNAYPDLLLCLSSNGLNVSGYVQALINIGVRYMTITVNAVDPDIGARIYSWVSDGNIRYTGREGARYLLDRQLEAIRRLKQFGITVKVNTVVVPGVNDHHLGAIAKTISRYGVDLMNCIGMIPVPDTIFANLPKLTNLEVNRLRDLAAPYLPQMRHCVRCRADAAGMLREEKVTDCQTPEYA